MGQAKARGTFEQRREQAYARRDARDAALSAQHRAEMLERQQREDRLRERVMVAGGGGSLSAGGILATALAMAVAAAPRSVRARR